MKTKRPTTPSNERKQIDRVYIFQKGSAGMNKQEFTQRVLAMENRLYRSSCWVLDMHE